MVDDEIDRFFLELQAGFMTSSDRVLQVRKKKAFQGISNSDMMIV